MYKGHLPRARHFYQEFPNGGKHECGGYLQQSVKVLELRTQRWRAISEIWTSYEQEKMALKKWLLNEDSISSESFDNAPNRIMELRRLDL